MLPVGNGGTLCDWAGTHEYVVCKAIATFKARHHDEISFLKGDEMELFVDQPESEDETTLVSREDQTALNSREPGPEHEMLPSTLATMTRNAFALGTQDYMGTVLSERAGPSPAPSAEWCFEDNSFRPGHAPLQQSLWGFEPPTPAQTSEANQLTPHDIAALVNIAANSRLYKHKDHNADSAAPAEHSTLETLPSAQRDGFLERIALDEGGATSKSPRTLPDEVYHCYMLGKSMQDLWVPPENIAFQSQGWKNGDRLRSAAETMVDEDELQHYYQIGKSVQEMWALGYSTDVYGRPELAHARHSDAFSTALPTQAATAASAGPETSKGANSKLPSGRKLLPDIQEMWSHGSGRPASASLRQPVSNGLDIDDDDFLDDSIYDQGPSNRRVAYERSAGQASGSTSRPRASSASRDSDRRYADTGGIRDQDVGFGGTGRSNYVETIKNNRGVSRKHVAACEDDDLLDDYEDGEVDIDSGTEDIIQDRRMSDRRMGIGAAQAANRPTSASQSRPSRDRKLDGLAARSSVRPASASIAAIHERRQMAARPASAAPSRSVSDSSNNFHSSRQGSHSSAGVGRALDYPVSNNAERKSLRPASASVARPASASLARPGSARMVTHHSYARPASASILRSGAKDLRHDDIARSNHREEREILDILSDHSEYESDLELKAEVMAMNSGSNEPNQRNTVKNEFVSAKPPRNKHAAENVPSHHQRPSDAQRSVRSGDQDLESRRAQLLAKTEIGLDHSEYESDDPVDTQVGRSDPRDTRAQLPPREASRDKYPALEQINARITDRQYEERQVVGGGTKRPERPSDSGRPQRPSDRSRAPTRSSRPADSNAGRRDLRDAVTLSDHSEYESNDEELTEKDRPHLEGMSGTLKWLEDGLTIRDD